MAKRIIALSTLYVNVKYTQALALSTAYQGGIVLWAALQRAPASTCLIVQRWRSKPSPSCGEGVQVRAMAWKNVPVTRPRCPPAGPISRLSPSAISANGASRPGSVILA